MSKYTILTPELRYRYVIELHNMCQVTLIGLISQNLQNVEVVFGNRIVLRYTHELFDLVCASQTELNELCGDGEIAYPFHVKNTIYPFVHPGFTVESTAPFKLVIEHKELPLETMKKIYNAKRFLRGIHKKGLWFSSDRTCIYIAAESFGDLWITSSGFRHIQYHKLTLGTPKYREWMRLMKSPQTRKTALIYIAAAFRQCGLVLTAKIACEIAKYCDFTAVVQFSNGMNIRDVQPEFEHRGIWAETIEWV